MLFTETYQSRKKIIIKKSIQRCNKIIENSYIGTNIDFVIKLKEL